MASRPNHRVGVTLTGNRDHVDSGSKDSPCRNINRIASMQFTKLLAGLRDFNIRIPEAAKLAHVYHPISALSSLHQSDTPGCQTAASGTRSFFM